MRKSQNRRQAFKGSITVFLSIIFIVFLSLIGAMIQSATIQSLKSIKRADMNLALENMFAEYQVDLLKQYDVFAREGTSERHISDRLEFYGIMETDHHIVSSQLLSDKKGQAFYEQAVKSMGKSIGDGEFSVDEFDEETEVSIENRLEQILTQEGQQLPEENNPIEAVKKLKSLNLLSLVYPNQEELSNRNIQISRMPSHRTLETGVGNSAHGNDGSISDKALFALYLTTHFSCGVKPTDSHPLAYEIEYLLSGKASDKENLKVTAEKILAIRMAVNYAYLLTDQSRQAEAATLALGLSSLLTAPEASEAVKQAILLAWAYGESILDLRVLFQGKCVPVLKTSASWQLQLSNIFQLSSEHVTAGESGSTEGIDYQTYLKALLIAENKETLCMRALDLLELNTGIRVDECLVGVELQSECQLRGEIPYTFTTKYQYE